MKIIDQKWFNENITKPANKRLKEICERRPSIFAVELLKAEKETLKQKLDELKG